MERKNEEAEHILRGDYTVIDLEMTGLNPKLDKVIEIGAVRVRSCRENSRRNWKICACIIGSSGSVRTVRWMMRWRHIGYWSA